MSLEHIFAQFDQALNWNAALYISHKIIFIGLSTTLFTMLSTDDYALWANINSIIFLFLVWIDCGMRKSVPRFCIEFSSTRLFIASIVTIQLTLLILTLPWIYYSLMFTVNKLNPEMLTLCYSGMVVFITQGIANIIRLLFHSYFLNKQFNFLAIIIMSAEMAFSMILLFFEHEAATILHALFINKIIADTLLIIISLPLLARLLSTKFDNQSSNAITDKNRPKRFLLYSCTMWIITVIKSFTERNFLVPFITNAINPEIANAFKISNDMALLFYRFIIKTIGTADTSLLAHSSLFNDNAILNEAFHKLIIMVMRLCALALIVIMIMSAHKTYFFDDSTIFQLFITVAICYVIEALLSPFERLIEIKESYFYHFVGHIPYLALIGLFAMPSYGIVNLIISIQVIRLASSFLITGLTYKKHNFSFPLKNTI